MIEYSVVIPTVGRPGLLALLSDLHHARGPAPAEIVVVDDRHRPATALPIEHFDRARIVSSGGRGPASARNAGWRDTRTEWVAFLDDDVRTPPDWPARLAADLRTLPPEVAASQARITVPLPAERRPTDDERGTAGLAAACWITADMAYRRTALCEVGGFDERFPRAYREDADLALRVTYAGYRIERGDRVTTHPVRRCGPLASVGAQAGNADNALMRRKHGRRWRSMVGEGPGRLGCHVLTISAALAGIALASAGRRRAALASAVGWVGLTAQFAGQRIVPGPGTPGEVARMVATSVLIPPIASAHRLAGELRHRRVPRTLPAAVLFDRDDTLITDVPYLADPSRVAPIEGAGELLSRLRDLGIPVGVVSNQSGVARGLITRSQLAAVNARVEQLLGPFDTWQVCVHGEDDRCTCRKPHPELVLRAASVLGVNVRHCVVIGDTGVDVQAARAAGARAVLVPTPRTRPEEIAAARHDALVAEDLRHAVLLAVAGAR